jgi:hypothetical protein
MQYTIHSPNGFIQQCWSRLLPDWYHPVRSLLIVLQHADGSFCHSTVWTDAQKDLLRLRFLELGWAIATRLRTLGHLATPFDPKTGLPCMSRPGDLSLDDVAVVRSCLGYPTMEYCGCAIALHPAWGMAVYPSLLLSSAEPATLEQVVREVCGGWGVIDKSDLRRSAYHQFLSGEGSLTQ